MVKHNRRLYSYKDLQDAGYGHPTTIARKIKCGKFPPPDLDLGDGERPPRPRWFPETLDAYVKRLRNAYPQDTS